MNIIIIGAGFTGIQLAKRLISEKNDVVLIDNNEETVRHASNRLDCLVVQASGNSLETLQNAGISKADALVAVTDSDEVNMITCSLVDSVYPDIIKIARVRNYDYYTNTGASKNRLNTQRPLYGIDHMVHPDVEAAQAIAAAVERGAVTEGMFFENSDNELYHIQVEPKSLLDGVQIQDMRQMTECEFLLAFIEHKGEASLPSGTTRIQADNRIAVLTAKKNLPIFLSLAGAQTKPLKRIALIGAGKIGTSVAEQILENEKPSFLSRFFGLHQKLRNNFVIIDKDRELANEASARFPGAMVYNADITDEGFIEEENLSSFDLVIAATRNHELNMVTSAYLKSLGVAKTICLVTSAGFATIARNIGIDVAVPIKDAVVDSILSHLRGKSVTEIHTVSEGELEVVEFRLSAESPVVGKQLKQIAVPGSFLVLLIKKSNEFFIPGGDTVLEDSDKLVIIVHSNDTKNILIKLAGKIK